MMRAPISDLPVDIAGVSLRAGTVTILDDVTLTIRPGPALAIIGPNGAGKTSLLRLAMGLDAPTGGTITWGGRDDRHDVARRAIVFQRPVMLRRSVAANIGFALTGLRLSPADAKARIEAALRLARLEALADRPSRKLSGGEQQRLALARALAREPELLFLDEPGNNLDPAAARAVETIIAEAAGRGIKVVMVTHDLGQARRLAGEVAFMAGGRLVELAPADRFFNAPSSPQADAFLRGDLVL